MQFVHPLRMHNRSNNVRSECHFDGRLQKKDWNSSAIESDFSHLLFDSYHCHHLLLRLLYCCISSLMDINNSYHLIGREMRVRATLQKKNTEHRLDIADMMVGRTYYSTRPSIKWSVLFPIASLIFGYGQSQSACMPLCFIEVIPCNHWWW